MFNEREWEFKVKWLAWILLIYKAKKVGSLNAGIYVSWSRFQISEFEKKSLCFRLKIPLQKFTAHLDVK